MIRVEMQLVLPIGGTALNVVRRAPVRGAAQAARQNYWQGVVRRVQHQHAGPPAQLWEIPAGNANERLILDWCGVCESVLAH